MMMVVDVVDVVVVVGGGGAASSPSQPVIETTCPRSKWVPTRSRRRGCSIYLEDFSTLEKGTVPQARLQHPQSE